MNDNEMKNTITEELAENTSEVVEEVAKQSFIEKRPHLATIGTAVFYGVLIGSGLYAGVATVRFAVKGGQMLYGKIKEKIKDKKEAKNQSDNVDEIDE